MKKVVDKVALKLGVPSSRVRLYNAGSVVSSSDIGSRASSTLVNSLVNRGANNCSPSQSCWAVVGMNAPANRFQGMKLEAIVVEEEMTQ